MYYAEAMIDGVLCWRSSPEAEWTPYTLKELTGRYLAMKKELAERFSSVRGAAGGGGEDG
jgi:hypothetical protein